MSQKNNIVCRVWFCPLNPQNFRPLRGRDLITYFYTQGFKGKSLLLLKIPQIFRARDLIFLQNFPRASREILFSPNFFLAIRARFYKGGIIESPWYRSKMFQVKIPYKMRMLTN